MERTLGDLWAPTAHWCHFSLNDGRGPYHFPAAARTHVPAVSIVAPTAAPLPVMAPAAVALTPAQHTQSLEIVVTGRADDHGGPEFLERLVAAASHNHALLTRAGIAHTFTLVEWNPTPGRPLLAEGVAGRLPFWDRAYVVDPEWHAAIATNPRLQFMEFFAKNVAVRRSTADVILTTNSDVFLSTALVARLAAAPLDDEHVYRAVRYDVDRHCDWRRAGAGALEAVLADPRHHVRVNELTAPEFSNASGDFLLLTRATWQRLRGFNETVRFAKIHKDAQFCHRAWIEGLPFDDPRSDLAPRSRRLLRQRRRPARCTRRALRTGMELARRLSESGRLGTSRGARRSGRSGPRAAAPPRRREPGRRWASRGGDHGRGNGR